MPRIPQCWGKTILSPEEAFETSTVASLFSCDELCPALMSLKYVAGSCPHLWHPSIHPSMYKLNGGGEGRGARGILEYILMWKWLSVCAIRFVVVFWHNIGVLFFGFVQIFLRDLKCIVFVSLFGFFSHNKNGNFWKFKCFIHKWESEPTKSFA